MDIKNQLLSLSEDISNGKKDLKNRIDGMFYGDGKLLLSKLLSSRNARFMMIKTFVDAIPANALKETDVSILSEFGSAGYMFDLSENKLDLMLAFICLISCFDSVFIFSEDFEVIFYADDNLEDVTITLEALA